VRKIKKAVLRILIERVKGREREREREKTDKWLKTEKERDVVR
jgi:hypothetical protein